MKEYKKQLQTNFGKGEERRRSKALVSIAKLILIFGLVLLIAAIPLGMESVAQQSSDSQDLAIARSNPAAQTSQSSNAYWNANSQKTADWVVANMYNPEVQMLATDPGQGCQDPLGGVTVPCKDAFWTTSDNLPTCATLQDYGYQSISAACMNKVLNILQFTDSGPLPPPQKGAWMSGWRYEAYDAIPIPIGSPGDQHFIVETGTLADGQPYAIKADVATGNVGSPNINAPVDVAAPQAINYYLRGDLADSQKYANNLISKWDGFGIPLGGGTYSTWQLGQVMFVMRVLKLDQSTSSVNTAAGTMTYSQVFNAMESQLWCVQYSDGHMPNQYNSSCQGSGGKDAENQDAALLPFSYSVISLIQDSFGECALNSAPPGTSPSCSTRTTTSTTTSSTLTSDSTGSSTTSSYSSSSSFTTAESNSSASSSSSGSTSTETTTATSTSSTISFGPGLSTSTLLYCNPDEAQTHQVVKCHAVVFTTSKGQSGSLPTGIVMFESSKTGGTFGLASCTNSAWRRWSLLQCSIDYTTSQQGDVTLEAVYSGDASHTQSLGKQELSVGESNNQDSGSNAAISLPILLGEAASSLSGGGAVLAVALGAGSTMILLALASRPFARMKRG